MPSHDHAKRRRSQRHQKADAGVWVYVPAETLERAGWPLDGSLPFYRTWGRSPGQVLVRLYKIA